MAFPRPMPTVPAVEASATPSIHRSRSRQALSRLNSIRRDRQRPTPAYEEARPDSATLNDQPRIMAPARACTTTRTQLKSSERPLSPMPSAKPSPLTISSPIGPPWYPTPEEYGGYGSQLQRYSAKMPSEAKSKRPYWLSGLRSALRVLIIAISAAVVGMLVHTLQIYQGNTYLDLRNGEIPMTWPAHTNLDPTYVLFSIAAANFLVSVVILALSFNKSFRRPIRSRDIYRIIAGSFGVISWVAALVAYNLLSKASKANLKQYACANENVMSNGRYQYRAVCSEQGAAFYLAIGAAFAEVLTLVTLAVTAAQSAKQSYSPVPTDDKVEMSGGATGRFP